MRDYSASGTRRGGYDDELPPPPVSPPRARSRLKLDEAPPGYAAPSMKKGEELRQENIPRRKEDINHLTGYRLAIKGEKLLVKNSNGEEVETELPKYSVWGSSFEHMGEFGMGVGLYFRQLLLLSAVIVVCAIIYIPSIVHNSSFNSGNDYLLIGTAEGAEADNLSLTYNGVPDLVVTLMLVTFALMSRTMEKKAMKNIDDGQQTPQDYSVCIHNPPRGLTLPEDYHKKFKKHGEIVSITVCVNNGNIMKAVRSKRVIEHKIYAFKAKKAMAAQKLKVEERPAEKTTKDLLWWQAMLQKKFGMFATQDYLTRALDKQLTLLRGLSQRHYIPQRVYITFNKEIEQRLCLRAAETGIWERVKNHGGNQEAVIEGKVCRIIEAEEPSEIIWENIDTPLSRRVLLWSLSAFLSALFLAGGFYITMISGEGPEVAILIALINIALPIVIRTLTLAIEEPKSLTGQQASMMFKLVITRCINSAFLLFIAIKDEERFKRENLRKIMFILIADAFVGPFLRLTNIWDQIMRKVVASKKQTQAEMNVYFEGADWNLAERYTDVIKTVFVGLFYSAIVPTGIIVTAVAMQTLYWVDKYSLLRLWKRPPAYDGSLSSSMRRYMILCVWLHLFMARVFFAKWPSKDNVALPDCKFFRCDNDASSSEQRMIVNIYEVLGILVFLVSGVFLLLWYTQYYGTKFFIGKRKEVGDPVKTRYRDVPGIDAYIPAVAVRELTYPLLAIDVDDLPQNAQKHLPIRIRGTYEYSSLGMSCTSNFPGIEKNERDRLFARVQYYPGPNEALQQANPGPLVFNEANISQNPQHPAGAGGMGLFDLGRHARAANAAASMLPAGSIQVAGSPLKIAGDTRHDLDQDLLPGGWEERVSGDGRHYYVSHETRTSQWERPTAGDGAVTSHQIRTGDGGITDVHSAIKDLPGGWEVRKAPAPDGRLYYVDHNTQATSWEHPGQLAAARALPFTSPLPSSSAGGTQGLEAQYTRVGLKYYVNPSTKEAEWSPVKADYEANNRVSGVENSTGSMYGEGRQIRSLPSGWELRTTSKGREYFVNHDQRITQWNPPDPIINTSPTRKLRYPQEPVLVPVHPQPQQPPKVTGGIANTDAGGGVGGGYKPTNGGHASHVSGGIWPASVGRQDDSESRLPGYIEIRVNAADGRKYYVNHRTKVTTWRPPSARDW